VPVSSSGHLVLLPVLLEWPYARLEPELRKTFEVALHAGTAVALLVALRHEVADVVRDLDSRGALGAVLTFAPAALAGLALEEAIERQAGTPLAVAAAQVLAGIGLAVADRRPDARPYADAGTLDHLAIGLAQAAALVPGVSRNGATLTAARLRGLDRPAASRLSRHAALPAIVGAAALKGVRLVGRGVPAHLAVAFSTGAAAAFASTLASRGLLGRIERARSYLPLAAYRVALGAGAAVLLRRRRRAPSAGRQAGRVPAPVAPCASMAR
jgi:undecaprenyl-diphosphatase